MSTHRLSAIVALIFLGTGICLCLYLDSTRPLPRDEASTSATAAACQRRAGTRVDGASSSSYQRAASVGSCNASVRTSPARTLPKILGPGRAQPAATAASDTGIDIMDGKGQESSTLPDGGG